VGEWGEVDEVLDGPNYAALQGVTISFTAWVNISTIDHLVQQLPLLSSRGILQVVPLMD